MGVNIFQQIGGVNVVVSEHEHEALCTSTECLCFPHPRRTISLLCSRGRFISLHAWH
jgi:hypothetical protein